MTILYHVPHTAMAMQHDERPAVLDGESAALLRKQGEKAYHVGQEALRASLISIVVYASTLLFINQLVLDEHYEYLSLPERLAAGITAIFQLSGGLTRLINCVARGGGQTSFSVIGNGGLIAILIMFTLSGISNLMMATMPTPVLVDSMTGNREMMIRWCEFVSLAFLMTFLTDSLDTAPTARPWFHSIALGCICLCGLLLPILSVLVVPNIDVADVTVVSLAGGAVWYLLLSVAVMLYIYVMGSRWIQMSLIKQQRTNAMNITTTVSLENSFFHRLQLAASRLTAVTTLLWTLLIVIYLVKWRCKESGSLFGKGHAFHRLLLTVVTSILGEDAEENIKQTTVDAFPFFVDCACDVVLKFVYAAILAETYEMCLDRTALLQGTVDVHEQSLSKLQLKHTAATLDRHTLKNKVLGLRSKLRGTGQTIAKEQGGKKGGDVEEVGQGGEGRKGREVGNGFNHNDSSNHNSNSSTSIDKQLEWQTSLASGTYVQQPRFFQDIAGDLRRLYDPSQIGVRWGYGDSNNDMHNNISVSPPVIRIDKHLILSVFRNAVSNACRYGKQGGYIDCTLDLLENKQPEQSSAVVSSELTNAADNSNIQQFQVRILRLRVVNEAGVGHKCLTSLTSTDKIFQKGERLFQFEEFTQNSDQNKGAGSSEDVGSHDGNDDIETISTGLGGWVMRRCAGIMGGKVQIQFNAKHTVFELNVPVQTVATNFISATAPTTFATSDVVSTKLVAKRERERVVARRETAAKINTNSNTEAVSKQRVHNLIFLDIDGVLLPTDTDCDGVDNIGDDAVGKTEPEVEEEGEGGFFSTLETNGPIHNDIKRPFSNKAMSALSRVMKECTDAAGNPPILVLTSVWRVSDILVNKIAYEFARFAAESDVAFNKNKGQHAASSNLCPLPHDGPQSRLSLEADDLDKQSSIMQWLQDASQSGLNVGAWIVLDDDPGIDDVDYRSVFLGRTILIDPQYGMTQKDADFAVTSLKSQMSVMQFHQRPQQDGYT